MAHPTIGNEVRIQASGRYGKIVIDDVNDDCLRYKVKFDDGATPGEDWFALRHFEGHEGSSDSSQGSSQGGGTSLASQLRQLCQLSMLLKVLWPISNVFQMTSAKAPDAPVDVKGNFTGGKLRPYHNMLADWFGVQLTSLPKIGIAVLCWLYTVDMEAASEGYDFSFGGWISKIVFRDLFLLLLIPCCWDWLHHSSSSPLKERLAAYKFESASPDAAQFRRDFLTTCSALVIVMLHEVVLMRWWAGGSFKRALFGFTPEGEAAVPWGDNNPFFGSEYTPYFILWTVSMLHWRITQFWFIHRMCHPWWDRENGLLQGDLGAVLYYYVHSHHHKSYNPTCLTGISMLPWEASLYFWAAFIPLFFRCGCHPWLYLYTKLDLVIGAQFGHCGFDNPSTGSYFHQLHHAHFECNYGDSTVPLDWLFGTFQDGSEYASNSDKVKDVAKAKLHVQGKVEANTATIDPMKMPLLAAETGVPKCSFTMEEVSQHISKDDCWVVLHGIVLDVTYFLKDHPGGESVLFRQAGKDATGIFENIHGRKGGYDLVKKHAPDAPVGYISEWVQQETPGKTTDLTCLKDCVGQVVLNGLLVASSWGLWVLLMGST